jgi:hypothetical protein
MTCQDCQRDFPADLLNVLEAGTVGGSAGQKTVCPVCALAIINGIHGLPPGTPFRGPRAAALYGRALAHLKATGQE